MARGQLQAAWMLPRPGKGVRGAMLLLFAIWLAFALAVNWADTPRTVFDLFCGNDRAIIEDGQLWRLLSAPLLHDPRGIGHILSSLIGLFFLGPSLEEHWGTRRFVRFAAGAAVLSYVVHLLLALVLPASVEMRVTPPYWFGAVPVVEAIVVAFALSFPEREVRLFFVLPVTSKGLIAMTAGLNVLLLIVRAVGPSGFLALFGGMLAGWLLGGGSPPPLRRWWLRWKLRALDKEVRGRTSRRKRPSGWRVIDGGSPRKPPDDDRTLH